MELDKFIAESLLSIHRALKQANNELTKDYPDGKKKNTFLLKPGSNKNEGEGVHFDLAITSAADTEINGKAKVGIFVLASAIGVSGKRIQKDESVSRISFTVDVSRYSGGYEKKVS